MDNSVYIILSRQMAQFQSMAVTADNIANVSTPGYSAQKLQFTKYLADSGNENNDQDAYANTPATYRDTSNGPVQITNNPFDLAIRGNAYFQVQTPLGPRYTKAGNFQVDANGMMVTNMGYPVLGNDNSPISLPAGARKVEVNASGQITVDGQANGQVGMVEFPDEQRLTRLGNSLYETPEGNTARPSPTARMVQGALEGSNVNGVTELTKVIEISRSVNDTSKFMESMYDLERKSSSTFTTVKPA